MMTLAQWIWSEDEDATPEFCVQHTPWMNGPCWARLIAKVAGVTIIIVSCFYKIPMILNLFNAKSSSGLSRASFYCDALVFANQGAYAFRKAFPFTTYGENVVILVQQLVLIVMMWYYTENLPTSVVEYSVSITAAVAYVLVVAALPQEWLPILISTILPMITYSRGCQIWTTLLVKHTGAMSIVTEGLGWVASLIRICTTVEEVGWDFVYMSGYVIALTLASVQVGQYIFYRRNTARFYLDRRRKVAELTGSESEETLTQVDGLHAYEPVDSHGAPHTEAGIQLHGMDPLRRRSVP